MLDNNSTSGRWLHRGGFSLLRNFFFGQENEVFYLVMFQIVALMSALRRARLAHHVYTLNPFLSLLLIFLLEKSSGFSQRS